MGNLRTELFAGCFFIRAVQKKVLASARKKVLSLLAAFSRRFVAKPNSPARLKWLAKADYNSGRMLIIIESGYPLWGAALF